MYNNDETLTNVFKRAKTLLSLKPNNDILDDKEQKEKIDLFIKDLNYYMDNAEKIKSELNQFIDKNTVTEEEFNSFPETIEFNEKEFDYLKKCLKYEMVSLNKDIDNFESRINKICNNNKKTTQ